MNLPLTGLGSHHGYHNNGFNVLFGDGSVRFLKNVDQPERPRRTPHPQRGRGGAIGQLLERLSHGSRMSRAAGTDTSPTDFLVGAILHPAGIDPSNHGGKLVARASHSCPGGPSWARCPPQWPEPAGPHMARMSLPTGSSLPSLPIIGLRGPPRTGNRSGERTAAGPYLYIGIDSCVRFVDSSQAAGRFLNARTEKWLCFVNSAPPCGSISEHPDMMTGFVLSFFLRRPGRSARTNRPRRHHHQ